MPYIHDPVLEIQLANCSQWVYSVTGFEITRRLGAIGAWSLSKSPWSRHLKHAPGAKIIPWSLTTFNQIEQIRPYLLLVLPFFVIECPLPVSHSGLAKHNCVQNITYMYCPSTCTPGPWHNTRDQNTAGRAAPGHRASKPTAFASLWLYFNIQYMYMYVHTSYVTIRHGHTACTVCTIQEHLCACVVYDRWLSHNGYYFCAVRAANHPHCTKTALIAISIDRQHRSIFVNEISTSQTGNLRSVVIPKSKRSSNRCNFRVSSADL